MKTIAFCFIIGSLVASVNSLHQKYYFVVAPNVIRFDHTETVAISIFGNQKNVKVTVWLQHREKKISEKTVTVPDEQKPKKTTVHVNESDIFDAHSQKKPRQIKLCSRRWSEDEICRDLVLSYKTGYLIIETDKPIYTPNQKVHIRFLALDESLKILNDQRRQVAIDIVSPSNLTLGRKSFMTNRKDGFYRKLFTLPPFPETGVWTARAFYRGHHETVSRSLFRVEEYVLPTFDVTIAVSESYILENTEPETRISITVTAEYVYGEKVDGTAQLSFNITSSMGDNQYLLDMKRAYLQNGVKEFSIKVKELYDAPALKNQLFPDGQRLLVVATVTESATGKEELAIHESTIFAVKPYKVKFTRSQKYFRPGLEFFVQVDVQTASGHAATDKDITIQNLDERGKVLNEEEKKTNSKGQALAIFRMSDKKTSKFKVIVLDRKQESDIFEVTAYADTNQIHVQQVTKDGAMMMEAFTYAPGDAKHEHTGMNFMIITRGKIELAVFKQPGRTANELIGETLQELINPSARILAFYVDGGTDKIVADSVRLDLEPKCRGTVLKMTPDKREKVPGKLGTLNITGNRYAWVGLNAIDKALLLLDDENILTKSKMFDILNSHDLGCGEGSGRNNGDVFKNAGLTVLTNARIENDVDRLTEGCHKKRRRKRYISEDDCYGADIMCCDYGYEFADNLLYETDEEEQSLIDPYVKCYAKARNMTFQEDISTRCIMAFFLTCQQYLEAYIYDVTDIMSKTLNGESDYASDLKLLERNRFRIRIRTDFSESFLFDRTDLRLSANGRIETINYPHSITKWMIQAIAISADKGFCIADPVEVRVFRPLFIQLDLPFKAIRLELFNVKATLFNYGSKTETVNVYLEGVEELCYSNEAGMKSPKQTFEIRPNKAQIVHFPMVPMKDGLFSVTVTAIATGSNLPTADRVEKKLLVVNEGIQETRTIQVCLDPNKQSKDCESTPKIVSTLYVNSADCNTKEQISEVDLTLPDIAIPGTGSATAYIQGNIMDNIVKTVLSDESLFIKPSGCGEQNIAATAPNVFALMYMKHTKQFSYAAEKTGIYNIRHDDKIVRKRVVNRHVTEEEAHNFIESVDNQKSNHMKNDGSYAIYQSYPSSVWLTAFVAKVFCHAVKVVEGAVDVDEDLKPTILWLNNSINQGQFKEIQQVYATYMMGQTKVESPGFTAFVLISLLECNVLLDNIIGTLDLATEYIEKQEEKWLKEHPHDLAICTYALALASSNRADDFKEWLYSIQKKSGENIYWGNSDSSGDAYSIETTAYALLAMLQFDDLRTSAHIVRWLTSQQTSRGTFQSTQDTFVALQGLTQYSIRTYSPDLDLKVSLLADDWNMVKRPIKNTRFQLKQTVNDLPVQRGNNSMIVKVCGRTGSGRMRIDLRYNRPAKDDEICPFEISNIDISEVEKYKIDEHIGKRRDCDVCGVCSKDPATEDLSGLTTTESNNVADSNFGRRKRQATVNLNGETKCVRFSVRTKNGNEHGMSNIIFNLETGVTVKEEDLKELVKDNVNLDMYEMPTDKKGFIVFYLQKLTPEANNFTFRLVDNFQGEKDIRQPAIVEVFDYYNPDKYCRKLYGTGPNLIMTDKYDCKADKRQCMCLQSLCARDMEEEIIQMAKEVMKTRKWKKPGKERPPAPAVKLHEYTCTPTKANYVSSQSAVLVRVTNVIHAQDSNSASTVATADVIRSIHEGIKPHQPGDKMTFYWTTSCNHPNVTLGKQYYIIAKDGHDVEITKNEREYRYPLMGTALVIESKPGELKRVMKNYEKSMTKTKGCIH